MFAPSLMMLADFNSIKVRLEPYTKSEVRDFLIFQFHKGAIRTTGKTKILVELAISIP